MPKKSIFAITIFIFLCVFLIVSVVYDQTNKLHTDSQFAMDTFMSYKLYGLNADKAISEIKNYVAELDTKLSLYNEKSEISLINKNAGKGYVKVSDETFEILYLSKRLCEESKGTLDITIAPLTKLWNITSSSPKVPDHENIITTKELVNYNDILFDNENKSVKLNYVGQEIDLGGFAKGFVCEKAVEICKKYRIKSGVISIGGNIAIIGSESINVNITVPEIDKIGNFAKLELKDTIIATSGGYERYFEENGTIYEHILDSFSGYPVESDLLSVSVISNKGIVTDAMSTRLYIEGLESIKKYLNDTSIGIIAVDDNKSVYVSDWLKEFVILNDEFSEYKFAE